MVILISISAVHWITFSLLYWIEKVQKYYGLGDSTGRLRLTVRKLSTASVRGPFEALLARS